MFHSVYKQRAFKENIIGVPQKLRKIICWGTFTTYRYSVLHNCTWKIRKRTPKIKKNYMSGYIYNLQIQCVAQLHVKN